MALFLPLPNLSTDALQHNLTDERRKGVCPIIKTISSSTAGELRVYSVWKKLLHTLLTVKCFNNEFSDFSFRLCSTWCGRHIMKDFHTLNNSESQIKFWSIGWYNFRGYLVSWGVSSSATFNFHYHWNAFKDIRSPTCKSKIINFHLRRS